MALNYVLVLKRNNPAIRKVTVPAGFKYVDVLARVFGQDNVQYGFRSLQSMITTGCFNAYREQRNSDDESSIETEEHLFRTPRTQLTQDDRFSLIIFLEHPLFSMITIIYSVITGIHWMKRLF